MDIQKHLDTLLGELSAHVDAIGGSNGPAMKKALAAKVNPARIEIDTIGVMGKVMAPVFGDPLDTSTRTGRRDVMIW